MSSGENYRYSGKEEYEETDPREMADPSVVERLKERTGDQARETLEHVLERNEAGVSTEDALRTTEMRAVAEIAIIASEEIRKNGGDADQLDRSIGDWATRPSAYEPMVSETAKAINAEGGLVRAQEFAAVWQDALGNEHETGAAAVQGKMDMDTVEHLRPKLSMMGNEVVDQVLADNRQGLETRESLGRMMEYAQGEREQAEVATGIADVIIKSEWAAHQDKADAMIVVEQHLGEHLGHTSQGRRPQEFDAMERRMLDSAARVLNGNGAEAVDHEVEHTSEQGSERLDHSHMERLRERVVEPVQEQLDAMTQESNTVGELAMAIYARYTTAPEPEPGESAEAAMLRHKASESIGMTALIAQGGESMDATYNALDVHNHYLHLQEGRESRLSDADRVDHEAGETLTRLEARELMMIRDATSAVSGMAARELEANRAAA